ncbi:hypothetical protein PO124_16220 [Bacillus licheniformis]|nr:hypothetical protein [Bacillus licheniformis]
MLCYEILGTIETIHSACSSMPMTARKRRFRNESAEPIYNDL